MHEYGVTRQIISICESAAKKHNASKIKKITLLVGEKSGFIGDSIALYFEVLSTGTLSQGAELIIETVKPMLRCSKCKKLFERKPYMFQCPFCNGEGEPSEIGKEFLVKNIEVVLKDGSTDNKDL